MTVRIEENNENKVQDFLMNDYYAFLAEDNQNGRKRLFLISPTNRDDFIVIELTTSQYYCDTVPDNLSITEFCEQENCTFIKAYDSEDKFEIIFKEV